MKRLICSFIVAILSVSAFSQLNGSFSKDRNGNIYFQAVNVSGYYLNATIVATSSDRRNAETITIGEGFILGPTTPWKWYWKKGDRITVTYPNGQSVYWVCPETDKVYSNISFRTGPNAGQTGYTGPCKKCSCPGGFTRTANGKCSNCKHPWIEHKWHN